VTLNDDQSSQMTYDKIEWFTGSGGPLLLLPEELAEQWSGIDPPPDERDIVQFTKAD